MVRNLLSHCLQFRRRVILSLTIISLISHLRQIWSLLQSSFRWCQLLWQLQRFNNFQSYWKLLWRRALQDSWLGKRWLSFISRVRLLIIILIICMIIHLMCLPPSKIDIISLTNSTIVSCLHLIVCTCWSNLTFFI